MMSLEARALASIGWATVRLVEIIEASLLFEGEAYMARVRTYHPTTIDIDGNTIRLHIRRMTSSEIQQFTRDMQGFGFSLDGKRVVPSSPTISDAEALAWIETTISHNITLPEGALETEDEKGVITPIRTGADLMSLYGARLDVLPHLLALILGENVLDESKKAEYRTHIAEHLAEMTAGATGEETAAPPRKRRQRKTQDEPGTAAEVEAAVDLLSTTVSASA